MESVIQYKTSDGKLFSIKEKALKYEKLLNEVNLLLDSIEDSSKYDSDCNFSNGYGYIQHPEGTCKKLEDAFLKLNNKYFKNEEHSDSFYYYARMNDDSDIKCLNKLSYKIMCLDTLDREFGQPYYRNNPDKAVLKQLNK